MIELSFCQIYGRRDQPAVLIGEVTRVEGDLIEYNINTFEGCSGATLFYADGDEAGHAIGCHCGGKRTRHGAFNFGFLF